MKNSSQEIASRSSYKWLTQKLGKVAEFKNGLNYLEGDRGYKIKVIGVQDFQDHFTISYDSLSVISLSSSPKEADLLRNGDLLFVRSNGNKRLIGRVLLIKDVQEPISHSGFTIRARITTPELLPEFVGVYLKSFPARKQIYVLGGGTNISNLSQEILGELDIPLPSLEEQKNICEVINCWDRAIEKLQALIAAKTQYKRGLMQQLLTGRKRFPEFAGQAWNRLALSDFAKFTSRITHKPDKPFKSLGIRSHGKGTFLKNDFEPQKIELTELFEVHENDLIVNITFAWEGAIAIAGAADSGALVSHRFPTFVFDTELAIPEYFRHIIVQKWFVEKLGLISPGGAGRNRVLSKKDFGKLEVLLPSVPEQQKIAAVLNACDREIRLLNEQLAALKTQKQGLMQKLLTGQVRVRVEEAAE